MQLRGRLKVKFYFFIKGLVFLLTGVDEVFREDQFIYELVFFSGFIGKFYANHEFKS
ncbi:hypothetical protein IWT30_00445 [Secundilactobacillus mixtipabuli]|uniref:Uncharacterized protein n=1 Tax=Secundilactobacillus mixtipabuli TaxID=1435342 RepID=A0A1Z5IAE0_9LACO|nr:hypothetical protein IWT30_00445 [Secundilactobacillus mixtipabuli]